MESVNQQPFETKIKYFSIVKFTVPTEIRFDAQSFCFQRKCHSSVWVFCAQRALETSFVWLVDSKMFVLIAAPCTIKNHQYFSQNRISNTKYKISMRSRTTYMEFTAIYCIYVFDSSASFWFSWNRYQFPFVKADVKERQ